MDYLKRTPKLVLVGNHHVILTFIHTSLMAQGVSVKGPVSSMV